MNNFSNSFEKIKRLKLKQVVYPAIITVFITINVVLFAVTAKFLSSNINKAFTVDEKTIEQKTTGIDMSNYFIIAKKMKLPIETETPAAQPTPETTDIQEATTTQEDQQENPVQVEENKTDLKIQILNSTKTKGLAGELKDILTNAGFIVGQTGNQEKTEKITAIKIKESKKNYDSSISELKTLISQKYAPGETQTLEENAEHDIVIVIGEQ